MIRRAAIATLRLALAHALARAGSPSLAVHATRSPTRSPRCRLPSHRSILLSVPCCFLSSEVWQTICSGAVCQRACAFRNTAAHRQALRLKQATPTCHLDCDAKYQVASCGPAAPAGIETFHLLAFF